jgi:hypothetical protein
VRFRHNRPNELVALGKGDETVPLRMGKPLRSQFACNRRNEVICMMLIAAIGCAFRTVASIEVTAARLAATPTAFEVPPGAAADAQRTRLAWRRL